MNRYLIIGDYDAREIASEITDELYAVTVPLRKADESLDFGIGRALTLLNKNGIFPTEDGIDILNLACLIYLCDVRISRTLHSQDSWTREITVQLPVYDFKKWKPLCLLFSKTLNFLTGDRWTITFSKRDTLLSPEPNEEVEIPHFDAVTLFSGGMDSLIGTINLLEKKKRIALISHAGDSQTKNAQSKLLKAIIEQYADNAPKYLDLWMSCGKNIIPDGERENSTRSRSFLFIAFGIFAISGMKNISTLQVPENGLIALNVPLDDLRNGAFSTRTTHPFYLDLWNQILMGLNFDVFVQNPYWNRTKGEMADECLNKEFLLKVIPESISCSSLQKARWDKRPPQHCGYCVPCIIRRAAMQKAFSTEADVTPYSATNVPEIIASHATGQGTQLRSFELAIKRIKEQPRLAKLLIHKSGKLPKDEKTLRELSEVYCRGLLEVDAFIKQSVEVSV
jgi:7-cyano-7-deazaguanine synthase in queuosine biosynthesis